MIDTHLRLLLGDDSARAFLRIMRSFERTTEKRRRYEAAVGSDAYPVGLLWGSPTRLFRCEPTASKRASPHASKTSRPSPAVTVRATGCHDTGDQLMA